jgi:lipoate-protein ligase A
MKWRVIHHGPAEGGWNMAVDEALMLAQSEGEGLPVLRFYGWEPRCFSLGRLQRLSDADWERLSVVDVVRRPTGGRGVWHADEVTYSVALRQDMLPEGKSSVVEAYKWLSTAWLYGLRELGVCAELAPAGVREGGMNCFAASAGSDFLVNGKKLIGAAQCRNESAILQHGSLLLSTDCEMWLALTGGSMSGAVSLQDLGVHRSREDVLDALTSGLRRMTGAEYEFDSLTPRELELANRLHNGKYRNAGWTRKGSLTQLPVPV